MSFVQATIGVVKQREFDDLKVAIEQALAGERVVKFLKTLNSHNIRVRSLDKILTASVLEQAAGSKAGAARALYESLPVSDQAQVREFYLSKIEEVEPALRAKFHKVYQYS
jgi:hypothetical protein